ncbi:carboxylesterase family protein [Nonomuraea sp. NN258]|uniref:carboxylesterase/lipase family protein n=1 Tax=Nonomuraea antri TaxID=2730852 RepID=UPI001568017A|nr:carboxylesterase family protein [Nonomuraea antri]NRQ39393.1 carboxylesterase family protein [Nonomuraea antri]
MQPLKALTALSGLVLLASLTAATSATSSASAHDTRDARAAHDVSAASAASAAAAPECADGTTVTTSRGQVCGTAANGVRAWLGIPYAQPPVGPLRWAPPRPASAWTDTLRATERGSPCPQTDLLGNASENEDCLKLNVVAPDSAREGSRLAVMVEFHGGGFRFGTPGDGSHLARSGSVIHVGVGYRLGVMGFLTHAGFGRNAGNYALRDQQEALRWVAREIAGFGGDPGNVTIFGASAGGSSVCAHTASPTAKGLFHKGIAQSGEYNSLRGVNTSWQPQDCKSVLPTQAEARERGERFATALGCPAESRAAAACLRAKPIKDLLAQAGDGLGADSGTQAPVVDGEVLTASPAQAFAEGRVNKVALMRGVGRDEVQLAPADTREDYERLVREQYGPLAGQVFARYPLARFPAPAPFIAYRTIVADSNSVCPALLNDERLARRIPVYAFQVDNTDAPPLFFVDQTKPNGAFHISELPFLYSPVAEMNANQRAFGAQLTAQWTGFARTGSPVVDGTPHWPRYTRSDPAVLSLAPAGDSVATREIARQHHCAFWNEHTPYAD